MISITGNVLWRRISCWCGGIEDASTWFERICINVVFPTRKDIPSISDYFLQVNTLPAKSGPSNSTGNLRFNHHFQTGWTTVFKSSISKIWLGCSCLLISSYIHTSFPSLPTKKKITSNKQNKVTQHQQTIKTSQTFPAKPIPQQTHTNPKKQIWHFLIFFLHNFLFPATLLQTVSQLCTIQQIDLLHHHTHTSHYYLLQIPLSIWSLFFPKLRTDHIYEESER